MPHVAGPVAQRIQVEDTHRHAVCGAAKELEPYAAGMAAEHRKVDTATVALGAQGQRKTGALGHPFGVVVQCSQIGIHAVVRSPLPQNMAVLKRDRCAVEMRYDTRGIVAG